MIRRFTAIALCLLAGTAWATAENKPEKKKEERRSVTMVLSRTVVNLENEFVPAADAMPEDKYSFAPTEGEFKGVRTYAQQIKHVAAVNYELAAAILEERSPVEINDEAGPASITSKADVIKWTQRGVHDEVIIDRVERSRTVFHLAAADENELRDNGVSESVIHAMEATARR